MQFLSALVVFTQTCPGAPHKEPAAEVVGNVPLMMTGLKDWLPGKVFRNI